MLSDSKGYLNCVLLVGLGVAVTALGTGVGVAGPLPEASGKEGGGVGDGSLT